MPTCCKQGASLCKAKRRSSRITSRSAKSISASAPTPQALSCASGRQQWRGRKAPLYGDWPAQALHPNREERSLIWQNHSDVYETLQARSPDRARAAIIAHMDFIEAKPAESLIVTQGNAGD